MKMILNSILGMSLLFSAANALADSGWSKVLDCDNGSVHIDNVYINAASRSYHGQGTMAQVVISNPDILKYFIGIGLLPSSAANEWVGPGPRVPDGTSTPPQQVLSFDTAPYMIGYDSSRQGMGVWANASVLYDGNGLLVKFSNSEGKSDNWYFHNCVAQ